MRKIAISAIVAIASGSAALAGNPDPMPAMDTPVIAAPVAGVDWSGIYAGGLASFDGGSAEGFTNNVSVNTSGLNATTGFGVFAGYNKQVNALVFGGEVAYTTGDVVITSFPVAHYTGRTDLKARLGYSMGRAMVYGVAGYSFADYIATSGDIHASSGLNYGAGVDFMVTDRIFVGAEYLVRNLSGTGALNPQNRLDSSLASASIRVGVKF